MKRNVKPEYSTSRINKAGKNIRKSQATEEDVRVLENWRGAHNKILNDWQSSLRQRCKGKNIVFGQRLKKRETIENKLVRYPQMGLATMQDLAGCRLVFENLADLNDFRKKLHSKSKMKHIRQKAGIVPYPYDYIAAPHPDNSGYRAIHDIYKYQALSNKPTDWNGLHVEIQYRTKCQHAWATAVEVAASITGNHTKFNQGDELQKEFFRLASELIARAHENMKSCFPDLSDTELKERFEDIEGQIHLLRSLKNLTLVGQETSFKGKNIILVFSETDKTLEVHYYASPIQATEEYSRLEKMYGTERDIVFVKATSLENLREAYRNYFLDTKEFTNLIESALREIK